MGATSWSRFRIGPGTALPPANMSAQPGGRSPWSAVGAIQSDQEAAATGDQAERKIGEASRLPEVACLSAGFCLEFYRFPLDADFVKMLCATLSSKYQLAVPKAIREELGLQAGQRFAVIAKGQAIELVPVRSVLEARGLLKGAAADDTRDRTDRF